MIIAIPFCRKVARSRADGQLAASPDHDMNLPVGPVERLVERRVRERVLMPDLTGQLEGDGIDVSHGVCVQGDAPRAFREIVQLVARPVRPPRIVMGKRNRIDADVALRRLLSNALSRGGTRVVVAVCDEDEHLATAFRVVVQVARRQFHRIPHGGASNGIEPPDARLERGPIIGHGHVELGFVGKVDHEHFVKAIRGPRQRQGGRFNLGPPVAHAATVVDHDPQRDRCVLAEKKRKGLPFAVLVHAERTLLQIHDHLAARVAHCGMDDDQPCFGVKHGRHLAVEGPQREHPKDEDHQSFLPPAAGESWI
jgi:hypothetical protein